MDSDFDFDLDDLTSTPIFPNTDTKLCMQRGVDPSLVCHIVSRDDLNTFELFLNHGIRPNITDFDNNPLWHYVKSVEMLQLLIDHGANFTSTNNSGCNALLYFIRNDYVELVDVLLSHMIFNSSYLNDYRDEEMPLLFWIDNPKIFKVLVAHGASLNIKDPKGNTVLHLISDPEIFEFLLEQGLDPDAQNNKGATVKDILQKKLRFCRGNFRMRLYSILLELLVQYEFPIKCVVDD